MSNWSKENGFDPCFCSVMHTFGSVLNFHPHMHILFACGGLGKNDELIETDFIPWELLKSRFRAILVRMLRAWVKDNVLNIPKSVVNVWRKKQNVSEFKEMLRCLFSVIWYVHVGEKLSNSDYTVRYIGRYAKRPSISEAKIVFYDGIDVEFEHKDKKTGRMVRETLSVGEFIGRIIRHIPDKHFRMIRYYGVYSNRNSEKYVKLKRVAVDKYKGDFRFDAYVARTWRERVIEATGEDPLLCPYCKEVMRLVEVAYRVRDGTGLKVVTF